MDSEKKVKEIVEEWLKDTSRLLNLRFSGLKEFPVCLKGKEHLIVVLDCSGNQLTSLPRLPKLTKLNCEHNKLTSLPNFPNLTSLVCPYNQLKTLPNFPNLTHINCDSNQLTSFPNLHKLTYLYCGNNKLKTLPSFPNLAGLRCDDNKLTSPPSFHNLTDLYCLGNKLFSFYLDDWKKIWPLQTRIKTKLRNKGFNRVIKVLKNRLYLPRMNQLHQELVYSPNHPGKFYKTLRIGNWSFEKLDKKPQPKLSNLIK